MTIFLNNKPFSLRSICRHVALKCSVMNYNDSLNNAAKMGTENQCEGYRDRGVTEIGFVTPSHTQSHPVSPSHGNFLPLFPDRGCVADQPQQVECYFDSGLTTQPFVKPSQTQSRSVKPSPSNFLPVFLVEVSI